MWTRLSPEKGERRPSCVFFLGDQKSDANSKPEEYFTWTRTGYFHFIDIRRVNTRDRGAGRVPVGRSGRARIECTVVWLRGAGGGIRGEIHMVPKKARFRVQGL